MRPILKVLLLVFAAQLNLFFPNKLLAELHAFEISMHNCDYAQKVAQTVMQKKKSLRTLDYYEEIDLRGPAIWEIVFDAYDVDQGEDEFANKWYKNCLEFSCSDFWVGMDAVLVLISND